MACVDRTTVLGYLQGTGMGSWYSWGTALLGQTRQKSVLLQRPGRGEDCPSHSQHQLIAWPQMFNKWEWSHLSGLIPPGSLCSAKQTGLLFDLF